MKGSKSKNFKKLYLLSDMAKMIMIFVLSSKNIKELFKNSLRKKFCKKLHKGNLLTTSPLFRQAAPKFVCI